jgi:hypothetical protein
MNDFDIRFIERRDALENSKIALCVKKKGRKECDEHTGARLSIAIVYYFLNPLGTVPRGQEYRACYMST